MADDVHALLTIVIGVVRDDTADDLVYARNLGSAISVAKSMGLGCKTGDHAIDFKV